MGICCFGCLCLSGPRGINVTGALAYITYFSCLGACQWTPSILNRLRLKLDCHGLYIYILVCRYIIVWMLLSITIELNRPMSTNELYCMEH